MRSNNKKYEAMVERRINILKFLIDNPCTSFEIVSQFGEDLAKLIRNDILFFKKCGAIDYAGEVVRNGRVRPMLIFKHMMTKDEIIEACRDNYNAYKNRDKSGIMGLPQSLLLMMGFNPLGEPTGGRFVNNEHFKPSYALRKMEINIGNHWGIMMEASQ